MRTGSHMGHIPCPALLVAACFSAGIVLSTFLPRFDLETWGIVTVCLTAAYVTAIFFLNKRPIHGFLQILIVGLAISCTGAARYAVSIRVPHTHLFNLENTRLSGHPTVEGYVIDFPGENPDGEVRFLLRTISIISGRDSIQAAGTILVTLTNDSAPEKTKFPSLNHGDKVRITGRIRRIEGSKNPSSFDVEAFYGRRGVYHRMFVTNPDVVIKTGTEGGFIDPVITSTRNYIETCIDTYVCGDRETALLKALLTGNRRGIDREVINHFQKTGLLHLLAVSGLHVLLVGMLLYRILRPLLIRAGFSWSRMEITRCSVTLCVLILYALITGSSPSVVRAVVMAALFMCAPVLRRSTSTLNTLGAAALVLLAVRPGHLFDPGFQLSFAAVGAILAINPVLHGFIPEHWLERPFLRRISDLTVTSTSATLGTMPVLLFHFGRAAFGGIALNLLAIPLTAALIGSGILMLITAFWAEGIAAAYGAAAWLIARLILLVADQGHQLFSWATINRPVENLWYIASLVAVILTVIAWNRSTVRWKLLGSAVFLAVAGIWNGVLVGNYRAGLDVVFFNVGNADAAVITFPNGQVVMVDTGARLYRRDDASSVILPYLFQRGIKNLNAVIITHADTDHSGGLPVLLRNFSIGRVLFNGCPSSLSGWLESQSVADSIGVKFYAVAAGDTLLFDPNVRVQVLSPGKEGTLCINQNESSIVLRVAYGTTSLLFTGDAGTRAETEMVASFRQLLQSDVVKVGHHGSSSSSSPAFVASIIPDTNQNTIAVISADGQSYRRLPDNDVLDRWRRQGAALWITGREGALHVKSDGTRLLYERAR